MATVPVEELYALFGKYKKATKNNIQTACPFCGKDDHFFINVFSQKWDCKKCGKDGGIYTLLKHLNKMYLLQGAIVDHEKKLASLKDWLEQEQEKDNNIVPDRKMPIGFTPLNTQDYESQKYYQYLRTRKFTATDFELYKPGYTYLKERYENYILIPIQRDFTVKGFIGRYIYNADADSKLRYQNSPNTPFSSLLFGYDEIDYQTESLILVEGVFDKVGATTSLSLHQEPEFKCCCTFGKKVSAEQIKLIKKTPVKNIFLMYDGRDAINDSKQRAFQLQQAGFRVMVCYLYPNDPADSTPEELLASLTNAKSPQQFWMDKINKRNLK